LQLYRDIRYSLSPRYELELAFSRLCWLGSFVSGAEVKKAIDAAQALLAGAPVQHAAPAQSAQPAAQSQQISQSQAPQTQASQQPAQPQVQTQPVPNGLPRLSMLDKMVDDEDPGSEPDSGPGGENANPFHDGGPLPPEQSVAAPEAENAHPAELDERLKLHIPQENVTEDGQVMPTVDIPLSDSGFTVNPDAEEGDDGWSNMDAPPDDDYYPVEADFNQRAEEYEAENSSGNQNASAPVQLQDTLQTASGQTISIAQLRGQITANLAVSDGFAASNVEKTGLWVVNDDSINTSVETAYDLSLIEKKKDVIAAEISNVCGRQMKFNVTLKADEPQKPAEKVEVPQQVNILVNAFKGTIVAGRM
jgi:DNA polymerase-3 subunit gamma/tau